MGLGFIEQMKSYIQTPSLARQSESIRGTGETGRGGAFICSLRKSPSLLYQPQYRPLPRQLDVEPGTLSELS